MATIRFYSLTSPKQKHLQNVTSFCYIPTFVSKKHMRSNYHPPQDFGKDDDKKTTRLWFAILCSSEGALDDVAIVHLNERHVKLRSRKVRGDNLPNNKTIAEKSVTQYIKPTQLWLTDWQDKPVDCLWKTDWQYERNNRSQSRAKIFIAVPQL